MEELYQAVLAPLHIQHARLYARNTHSIEEKYQDANAVLHRP